MIPNLINTIAGLVLVYATVLHPTWVGQRFGPFAVSAVLILVMALWARRSDSLRWYSNVNIACAIALGALSVLPLAIFPNLTFWAGLWIGVLVPICALWSVLYRPDTKVH